MGIWDVDAYRVAMDMGRIVWDEVSDWERFAKWTFGQQMIRACDSVAANLAEAHGRHHEGDRRQFAFYARGSLLEFETWLYKAAERSLVDNGSFEVLHEYVRRLTSMINGYLRSKRS